MLKAGPPGDSCTYCNVWLDLDRNAGTSSLSASSAPTSIPIPTPFPDSRSSPSPQFQATRQPQFQAPAPSCRLRVQAPASSPSSVGPPQHGSLLRHSCKAGQKAQQQRRHVAARPAAAGIYDRRGREPWHGRL